MKKFQSFILSIFLCSSSLTVKAQSLFAESKCTNLYYGYLNNKIFFNSKIDTNDVKIIGEGCEITVENGKMALVNVPLKSMTKYKRDETPTVFIKIIDKKTDVQIEEKLYTIKRIPDYKLFIDESEETTKIKLTNGVISIRCPDEATTCYLPRLDEYITEYQITIQGLDEVFTGTGSIIQQKQLKTIKKFKKKNPSVDLIVTLTLSVIDPNETKTIRKKIYTLTY